MEKLTEDEFSEVWFNSSGHAGYDLVPARFPVAKLLHHHHIAYNLSNNMQVFCEDCFNKKNEKNRKKNRRVAKNETHLNTSV